MVVSSGKRRESEDDVGRQQAQSNKSKRSRKKEAQAAAELEEERRLTALLFGTTSGDNDQLLAHHQHQQTLDLQQRTLVDSDTAEDVPLFEIDRTGDAQTYSILDSDKHKRSSTEKHGVDDDRSGDDSSAVGEDNNDAAWVDDDDEQLAVNILETNRLRKLRKSRAEEAASALPGTEMESRLRLRFQTTTQVTARTDWAKLDQSESPEQQNDVRSAAFPIFSDETKYSQLPSGILNVVRCPDANQSDPNQAVVQSVHFHPGSDSENPLLLTAGLDKTLRFFQVGTEKSVKVHGIHCKCRFQTMEGSYRDCVRLFLNKRISSSPQASHLHSILSGFDRKCGCQWTTLLLLHLRRRSWKTGSHPENPRSRGKEFRAPFCLNGW